MTRPSFSRSLRYDADDTGQEFIDQSALEAKRESLIVLGEAGMGKTELLKWLGKRPGHVYCTAKGLRNAGSNVNRIIGSATTLVVDALDELSAKNDGDAIGIVLQKLAELGFPRFVMSCRIADWRQVTGNEAIREQYPDLDPLVIHLQPLSEAEIRILLTFELDGDGTKADEVIGQFAGSALEGLLSNPQTLQMVARAVKKGPLPRTKAGLFEAAVDVLRREHSNAKFELQPDEQSALDAAGAAFAALILTGAEAVVFETAEPADVEIQIAEAAALPGAQHLHSVLGSRLFGTAGAANRLSYWHRSIGEYLGSRWLARQASSAMKRRRLLAMFHAHDVVPASLRGLHAWLAFHSSALADEVIDADPSGLVEYGDPGALGTEHALRLLRAMEKGAEEDQRFVVGAGAAAAMQGLMRPELLARIRELITGESVSFGLRVLMIESVNGSTIAEALRPELRSTLLSDAAYGIRWTAFEALRTLGGEDWRSVVVSCKTIGTNGARLAVDMMKRLGPAVFLDGEITGLIVHYVQHDRRMVKQFYTISKALPDSRLDGVLDALARDVAALGGRYERSGNDELTDLGYRLIERRLKAGPIDAARLWGWMRPFDAEVGYKREQRQAVHALVRKDASLRRAVQRLVLLDEEGPKTVWQRAHRLTSRSSGFEPTEEDVVALLEALDPKTERGDERWQDLLRLISHSSTDGVKARAAAVRFAARRIDVKGWIAQLAEPQVREWEIKQARETQRRQKQRMERWQQDRRILSDEAEAVRSGRAGALITLAEGYFDLRDDLDHEISPIERLTAWVGPEITANVVEGFEAFLHTETGPTAQAMAQSDVESSRWNAAKIIAAALAERVRRGIGMGGVPDDRLTAGFYELRSSSIDDHAKLRELQPAIEAEMKARGLMEAALRGWIEPALRARRSNISQLSQMMWSDLDDQRSADVAREWLVSFPDIATEPESALVDRLIVSRRFDTVQELAATRGTDLSDDRRMTWDSACFVAAFDFQRNRLSAVASANPRLFWAIRRRMSGRRHRQTGVPLSVAQLAWLLTTFRGAFPARGHPDNGWSGDENPWDATDFLLSMANRLADMTAEPALLAMRALVDAPSDSYTATFRVLAAEQRRKAAEERYRPPTLQQVRVIVEASPPATVADLQATLLELLEQIQKRLIGDPADPWEDFYRLPGVPFNEERCRNHLLTMLGPRPEGIDLAPEGHLAKDNRADISARLAGMHLPIEIKGQWHKDLWHAADTQLDRLYATDYAAERRGIYLVLWFGSEVPEGKAPRASGKGRRRPQSAQALREGLVACSKAAQEGRIAVVVLDIGQATAS